MTLLVSLVLLSCAVGAQAAPQGVAPTDAPRLVHAQEARALPDTTIACVSLSATPAQFDALVASPLVQVVAEGLALQGIHVERAITDTMAGLRLDREQVRTLATRGVTFGLMEIAGDKLPGWLLVVDAGAQIEALEKAVDTARQRTSTAGVSIQKTTMGGRAIWVMRHPSSQVCWTRHESTLVAGSSLLGVSAAVARIADSSTLGSLVLDPHYLAHDARERPAGTLLSAFVRPAAVARALQAFLPPQHHATIAAVRRAVDADRILAVGLTLAHDGTGYQETIDVAWPEPREGVLAHLLGHPGRLPANAGEIVPNGTTAFAIASADVAQVARATAMFLESLAPARFADARKLVRDWCKRADVDLETEVLASLGGQIAALQWLDRARGTVDFALVMDVVDRDRMERAVNKLVPAVSIPIQSDNVAGYRAHFAGPEAFEQRPGFAVTQRHLVVASTRSALQKALDRLAGRTANLEVAVPPNQVAMGVTDLTATLGFAMSELRRTRTAEFAKLGRPSPPAGPNEVALQALLAAGAVATTSIRGDARGLTFTSRSQVGPLAVVGVAMGLPRSQQSAQAATLQLDAHASVRLALAKLAAAQHKLRADTGSVRFSPLRALVESGVVDAETAGTALSDNLYTRDGFLLTALLGSNLPDEFAIVAWPADNRTGPVFATDDKGVEATNEIIARALGVSLVEIADVYTDGFGSPMRSGWRRQDAVATTDEQPTQATSSLNLAFQAIAALERTPPASGAMPAVLAEALRSEQPALVARACHALGVLRRAEDVPTLVQLAKDHPDYEVRFQAMWALTRMRDARAQPAALAGIRSDDVNLRALAASILGSLRVKSAVPALLGVAADPAEPREEQDRVAAIAALTDIGDPNQLLPIAAAVTKGSRHVVQALTYAFQTLSPRVEPSAEATILVAVLAHEQPSLRRYAILRLAELRIPATARALEGRLAQENRELTPLLQVAIDQVRNDRTGVQRSLTERAEEVFATVVQFWGSLPKNQRYAAGCGAIILLLVLGIGIALRTRARNRAAGNAWAALAAPSAGHRNEYEDEAYDEVDLDVGASGVYRGDEYEETPPAPTTRRSPLGTRR